MADWFFKLNDREKAIRILTSIADIDLENASLYRLLGYRLKEYKEYALESYICKKVIQWRPMEPQSYRDYALALADNGQYQVALDSLYSLLTQSYSQSINSRSGGIEEVVVTELNHLIAKNSTLNKSAINKELIKAMPVDIRVVINWNMNNTDIDLHVRDPYGEICFYSHKATAIGGRISQDITQGYGPEQFMLKKAVKGKYEVFVNYYGDSQVKAEGPSTIMAEIYSEYADKKEQRQVVCLQMSKESKKTADGKMKVAEFEF
jgi:tetratricopeptide (TPR) repeat protein